MGKYRSIKFSKYSGYSLIEVLVASTVFSFGLAGLATLLMVSVMESSEARNESTAAIAAASLAEQIRMNPASIAHYLSPVAYVSTICMGDSTCSAGQQADYDFRLWQVELADAIKNARGLVCRDTTPKDGVKDDHHCDGAGPLVIKIFWSGRYNGNGDSGHRFTLQLT